MGESSDPCAGNSSRNRPATSGLRVIIYTEAFWLSLKTYSGVSREIRAGHAIYIAC